MEVGGRGGPQLRTVTADDLLHREWPELLAQLAEAKRLELHPLFQQAFSVAKTVRTDTDIGVSAVSVAYAAVSLARQIFSELADQTALLIGAGETIELAARHLHQHGIGRIIVANRTVERAHKLANQFDGYAIALTELGHHLAAAKPAQVAALLRRPEVLGKLPRELGEIFAVPDAPRDILRLAAAGFLGLQAHAAGAVTGDREAMRLVPYLLHQQ